MSVVDQLKDLLTDELNKVLAVINDPGLPVELPDPASVELSLVEIQSLVARTSNTYSRLTRLAGFARAQAKITKGRYDREFKKARGSSGFKNDKEREAHAYDAAEAFHEEAIAADALAEMVEALESGARVASESARRMLGGAEHELMAGLRAAKGKLREEDYSPY